MRFLDLAFVIRLGEGEAQGALKEGQSIEDQEEKLLLCNLFSFDL